MRRTVLVILGVAGGLVALVLIGVAIAVATVDVNSFAAPLAARVEAATGRTFTIGGPLKLTLSLEPKLQASNVTLGNAPWGQAPALLRAARVEAQVALLPLLHRRFEIVQLTLVDPVISLETNPSGQGNWVFDGPAAPGNASAAGALAAAPALGIGELAVQNGTVSYRDGATGKVTPMAIELLTLHARDGAAPVTGDFRGSVDGIPIMLRANLGSLAALRAQQWPIPILLTGEIAGRNATLATKLTHKADATTLDETSLTFGALTAQGSIVVDRSGARPKSVVDLHIARLVPEALALPAAAGAAAGAAAPEVRKPASDTLVPDAPLPWATLRTLDAEGHLLVDAVDLGHGQGLARVNVRFLLRDGNLEVSELTADGLGGTMNATMSLRAIERDKGSVTLHLDGRDLELSQVLAVAGAPREVTGGKTRLTVELKATGASLHDFAASADGTVVMLVGPAHLKTSAGGAGTALDRVGGALNPLRDAKGGTELRCAVARLPLRNGVAEVDGSLAAETGELGVSASGTIDLRSETLDLALRPQLRQGIPFDVSQIAGLVHVRGPFRTLQIAIDPVKSAETLARIGAAVGTGGWSLLGETLINAAAPADSPCAAALSGKGAPSAAKGTPAAAAQSLPDLGKAIGRLFGR